LGYQPIRGSSDIFSDRGIPDVVIRLQKQLLGGYTLPPCPAEAPPLPTLSGEEILSLQHYLAWTESHGTVKAYYSHAKLLAAIGQKEILSLYMVRKLALKLTGLKTSFVDMCPKSCMAFTGDSQSESACSYKNCNEPRYKSQRSSKAESKPRATMLYMPIIPIIQAHYANAETSHDMRHRDHVLQQTLGAVAEFAGKKSEFSNSDNHVDHVKKMGLFKDKRDTALSISSDGAQLTMKKQSNMWLLIVVLLNLSPDVCYKADNIIIPLVIPGPSAPGNVESFIYPLFEELAKASVGMWTWDAVDSSYFVLRAYLCGVKGDMLGSAKLSGMAGHSAQYGDRFSLVQGARPSTGGGAKAQYYPISPPDKEIFNPRRDIVDLDDLPFRGQRHYWETIQRLELARTEAERKRIVLETGISRLTMCATSPAFSHPSFFPLDPFHLFYENCMVHIWDLWVTHSKPDEQIHMDKKMASSLGEEIEKAVKTLPSSFCSPIRNPYKKRNSQYKIYEWMALLHWYIIPIAWELKFDFDVLENFMRFADIVESAMSHSPKSDEELAFLYILVKSFLQGFEKLYVRDDPKLVTRCRLCIWQLIHVPTHIAWNGSIRFGSQATVERAIGEIGHKVRSKKAPFANIATMLVERATNKVLTLRCPFLIIPPKKKRTIGPLYQPFTIKKEERENPSEYHIHLVAICQHLEMAHDVNIPFQRWGKCKIPGNITLRSRISEEAGKASRSSRYFETKEEVPIFGEALAFYSLPDDEVHKNSVVVYSPLVKREKVFGRWCGKWSEDCAVLSISSLTKLVGIWASESGRVYMLRKHAGIDMLHAEEDDIKEEEE
jgi:Transposase family tnp2